MEKPIIMYDSPEAATYRTDIKGWVSKDGLFYGDNPGSERGARWSGCTHQTCACGNVHEKGRTICNSCLGKKRTERYYALPVEKWNGDTPICLWDDDRYFFDEDAFLDFLADLKHDDPTAEHEVQAVLCEPGRLHLISDDEWVDDLPDNGEYDHDIPEEVAAKVAELNEIIKQQAPVCWYPGKIRIDVDEWWAELKKGFPNNGKT